MHKLRQDTCRAAAIAAAYLVAPALCGAAPSFTEDVRPIFKENCFKCHNPDKKKADIDLTSYASVLAGGSSGEIVKSGSPDGSILYLAMAHSGDAETMPPKRDPLPEPQLAVVRDWITGGLIETEGGKAKPAKASPSLEVDPATVGEKPEGAPPMPEGLNADAPSPAALHPHPVIALAASPWAPLAAVSGHEAILLYDTDAAEYLGSLPFPEGTPHVLKFSRDGRLLLAAGGRGAHSGKVVIWDVVSCERAAEVGEDEIDSVLAADISADREYVALGGTDKILKVFTLADGELVHRIKKHTDWVTAIEFSPDGSTIASGDRNGGVHTWDVASGSIVFTLAEHDKRVSDLAWRPDGKMLASAAEDGKLVLWEMEEGFPTRTATPHKGKGGSNSNGSRATTPGVLSVEYSDKGALVSAGRDGAVTLMRSDTNPETRIESFEEFPTAAVFTHDGSRLVTGDFLGNVCFWEITREKGKAKAEEIETLSTKVASK